MSKNNYLRKFSHDEIRLFLIILTILLLLVTISFLATYNLPPATTSIVQPTPDNQNQTPTPLPREKDQSPNLKLPVETLSVSQIWQTKNELVGKNVVVEGRILFHFTCPPTTPQEAGCVAIAYLVDKNTLDLPPPYENPQTLPLYQSGVSIGCGANTLANFSCQELTHSGLFRLGGILNYQVLGGKTFDTLMLEVTSKEALD